MKLQFEQNPSTDDVDNPVLEDNNAVEAPPNNVIENGMNDPEQETPTHV
jgi:hypothetical protein